MDLPRGHGIGLRTTHYPDALGGALRCEVVEAISENFLGRGGRAAAVLERVRRDARVLLHGVGLSVGGVDPLRSDYLAELRALASRVEAALVTDHLCFGGWGGHHAHDLWPLPYTEEAIGHVADRVRAVQDALGRRIALENVSSYATYRASDMPEWEFVGEVARRADCLLLLDLNNVYVNAVNHVFDPYAYLAGLPADRVAQYHVAGHRREAGYLLDDHGSRVSDPVLDLYAHAVRRFGDVACIVEWDSNVPSLVDLLAESKRVRTHAAEALAA